LPNELSFKAHLPVIDANVGVGHVNYRPSPVDSPEQLLVEMRRHGVERAVIHHQHGEALSAVTGNDCLHEWLEGHEEVFIPQWMASPEPDSLKQLQELRAAGKLNNVRIHDSGAARIPFVDWVYGDLLEWLQQERIPVWISLHDTWDPTWTVRVSTPVTEIMDTLRAFPDLVTVLVGAHYVHSFYVRPLLKLPNTHIDLSRYEVLREMEALVTEFGAERLLYGSFYPRLAMGPILYYMHSVGFDDATLKTMCSGNLERILAGGER
jgi:predicted TIM-barrel fold metal-dependent hydrolase